MNIFEDLIEELKEENLLEETVTESLKKKDEAESIGFAKNQFQSFSARESDSSSSNPFLPKTPSIIEVDEDLDEAEPFSQNNSDKFPSIGNLQSATLNNTSAFSGPVKEPQMPKFEGFEDSNENLDSIPQLKDFEDENAFSEESAVDQAEFYKRRATEEVTSLQMVEHVLSGVERDFLNTQSKLYDDLEVKKSLHNFLQFSQNLNSPEQAQAEFMLMQETESWYSALSQKDKNITVYHLRRYCETTRPALSLQALAALARFYRNAPFSESIRSKFDLVITRFFAREAGSDVRKLTLSRDEIIEKLNEFYAEWSSIPLYATDDDESNILLAAIKFEEFMSEADEAESFETLLKSDFFRRLKTFKESTHENFFAPMVIASSIESNIRIGNRYLELLLKGKENNTAEKLEEEYGSLHNQLISEVLCKTFQITNIFEGKFAEADVIREAPTEIAQPVSKLEFEKQDLNKATVRTPKRKSAVETQSKLPNVNKWVLIATIAVIICSVGLFTYVEYFATPPKLSENVKVVNMDNSSLKEYIQTARLNGDMFYGVINPSWDGLDKEKKEELLKKILIIGGEKGFTKVLLVNRQGKNVGYASPEMVESYIQ